MPDGNLAVVILAAGRSSRMGRPKMLLPWGGSNTLTHIVEQWRELGARQIAVVVDPSNAALRALLNEMPGVLEITNPNAGLGMFSSIRAAASKAWDREIDRFAIALGDQPHLKTTTLQTLANASFTSVLQPAHNGKPRHPVLLKRFVFEQIANSEAATLKEFLSGFPPAQIIEINDPGLSLDIDTPEDYQKALSLSFPKDA